MEQFLLPCGEKHEDVGEENTVEGPTDEFMRKIRFNKERDWMNPIALMVRVFLFLLDLTILGSIVRNTSKFATQRWVKVNGYHSGKPKTPEHESLARHRCVKWTEPLTIGELIVWIAIRILMGVDPRKRIQHYWTEDMPGHLPHPVISQAMKRGRFEDITSCLCFLDPDDLSSHQGDKLRKIRDVERALLKNFQASWTPEQKFVIESISAGFAQSFNSWLTSPSSVASKFGVWFSFSVSTFLHSYEIFCGKTDGPGSGMRDSPSFFKSLFNCLIPQEWNGTGKQGFCHSLFTTSSPALTHLLVFSREASS